MSRILAHGQSFVSVKSVVHILEPNSGNNITVAYPRSHNNNNNNNLVVSEFHYFDVAWKKRAAKKRS